MAMAKLRAPVMLVHGFCGFDQVSLGGRMVAEYFPGIPRLLREVGNVVLTPCLSPTRGVKERAEELKAYLERHMPNEPVHILAHSMGGLDARYMISRLGMAERVLSLTTLGTPHRGSSFADWGLQNFGRLVVPFLRFLNIPSQALVDLTTQRCRQFNFEVPDAVGVRYFSVAGQFDCYPLRLEWLLPASIVSQLEGPNDGVVSVASALYGEAHEIWPCDHLSLINWPSPVWAGVPAGQKATTLFGKLLGRLRDEDF